jgi:hypothetical protein
MKHQDLRSTTEIFADMLSDDYSMEEIGARLGWNQLQCRQRYLMICRQLGVKPDEE